MSPAADGAGEHFADRREAGRRLAVRLSSYAGMHDAVVLGLPRGGVPVAYEIAVALRLPLDVFLVRKLGVPGQPELAMGAIGSGDALYINHDVVSALRIPKDVVASVAERERTELLKRETLLRGDRARPQIERKTVILVDDGLATGASMHAAVTALRPQRPAKIAVAVPVAPMQSCDDLRLEADDVVCLLTPSSFYAVGSWYDDFRQVEDDDVRDLVNRAARNVDDPPVTS